MLLYMIGRDHVRLTGKPLERLKTLFQKTHERGSQMSDRTLNRLVQFDDKPLLDALLRLPAALMKRADTRPQADIRNAKLARTAVYLALLCDTCARSGNIAGLDLAKHLMSDGAGKKLRTSVVIGGAEVKNGVDIRATLSPETAKLLRRYIDHYRPVHCRAATSWLFPRADGSHWTVTQAAADLKDLAARHVGAEVTPHLLRSLAGKVFLDERPGGHALVQQLLGHKSLATTVGFYTKSDQAKTRADYQALLTERRQ